MIDPNALLFAVGEALNPKGTTMTDIFKLERRDEWQFSIDVFKGTDGKLKAVLVDARASIIEADAAPGDKLAGLAKMLEQSVEGMRATAQAAK